MPETPTGGSVDLIELRGLQVIGICGALPEERDRAQPLEIDLDIECDLSAAGASDDLADTLDYGAMTDTVVGLVASTSDRLLERLADRIAAALTVDGRVVAVTVTVRKLRPPVPHDLALSAVRITRPGPAA